MTVYVNWTDGEILSEKQMNKRYEELLDLTEELGKYSFEEFCENDGFYESEALIQIITAEDKQEVINSLLLEYKRYINNRLIDIYDKIILD